MFFAERIDPGTDLVADTTGSLQPLLVSTGEFGRIVKRPVQASSDARKNRTTFRFSFATHGHDELEYLSRLPNIEDAPRRILRDIDSEFVKRLHDEWIDCAWF